MKPKISIITPNFNKGIIVRDTVRSVLNQTFKEWELIFIDDGSTDESLQIAIDTANGDQRCVFIKNSTGVKGANAARNLGIEKSRGDYIIFLDSDDVMLSTCLETRINDIEAHPEVDYIVYPMGVFFNKIGDSNLISNIENDTPNLHRFLNREIVWLISGPIWRKSAIEILKGFDLNLDSQQDYDLHVRALIFDLIYYYRHQQPEIFYRRNIESVPRQISQNTNSLRQRFRMNLRHFKLLNDTGKLGGQEKILIARYNLDIAQMMRWHINELGRNALKEALEMWCKTYDLNLVPKKEYLIGIKYLRFKHNMLFNRVPKIQRYIQRKFQRKLGEYFYTKMKYDNVL